MAGRSSQLVKIREKRAALRKELWGDLDPTLLWSRKTHVGFASIPRTMPLILQLIDELTVGKPASSVYFSLWCRNWDDDSMVEIKDRGELALEAGFTGARAVTTWTTRMRRLRDLGFIDSRDGEHEFRFVLIWNPHKIIKQHAKTWGISNKSFYHALINRGIETGGNDFIDGRE